MKSMMALVILLLTPFQLSAETITTPDMVVKETMNGIIDTLKAREDLTTITDTTFQTIHDTIDASFDFREMAKRSLAKTWKKIDPEQRASFTTTFQQLIERSYINRLAGYSGEVIEFGEVTINSDRAKVETTIIGEDSDIPVNYSLHQHSDRWQIYDVKIEGVSLVSTFRSSFRKTIKKEGFDGLRDNLNKKLERLKAKSKG